MSKLNGEYTNLKLKNPNKLLLFKCGIFYIALNEDAKKLNSLFDFKISYLNESVSKCGFPVSKSTFYINLLEKLNVQYLLVDDFCKSSEKDNSLKNTELSTKILAKILEIDMLSLTPKEAYEILYNLKNLALERT